jgi:glycosyltransferase involved in cell wall biosynthesis
VRILQLAPAWESVPPPAYGGTEAVVHCLTEGLVEAGHEVTLFATGDSQTSGRKLSVCPRPLRSEGRFSAKLPYDLVHVATALLEGSSGYDLIHNHAGELGVAFSGLVRTPMLTTVHCAVDSDWQFVWSRYRGYYCSVSRSAYRKFGKLGGTYLGPVYNGIDTKSFPFQPEKQDYLLFLSRISPEKAPHLAIEAALRAGKDIIVAGKVDPNNGDQQYFADILLPLIDGSRVRWFGEANQQQKRELYSGAAALLLPLQWEEPFGLVLAEAMACGTPPIAFRRGAAEEVIKHGVSGYLVDDLDHMVSAIGILGDISPYECREWVEEHFDKVGMVQRYTETYEQVVSRAKSRPEQIGKVRSISEGSPQPTRRKEAVIT